MWSQQYKDRWNKWKYAFLESYTVYEISRHSLYQVTFSTTDPKATTKWQDVLNWKLWNNKKKIQNNPVKMQFI